VAFPKRKKEVGGWLLVSITLQRYIGVSLDAKVKEETRGMSHCGLAIYIKKYLKAKRRIIKTQIIFQHAKK
jgi:hypothetical protein